MNVNIHTGGSGKSPKITGETATGSQATSKLGKIVGGVGQIAAKYGNLIPGVGGIVSTVGKMFSKNDPEWWKHVPSTGVTTNLPLQESPMRVYTQVYDAEDGTLTHRNNSVNLERPAILEINSYYTDPTSEDRLPNVINPSDEMVSTFLMQEVRKVLNAVPLSQTRAYREMLANSCTAYALKKQLEKMIVMIQNSKPFIPAITDGSFPALNADNYARLVSAKDILSEYIKASVKLPHTMCQYLTWRYGRVYRMNASEKAGLVVYNVIPMDSSIEYITACVTNIVGFASSSLERFNSGEDHVVNPDEKAKALADLFNAYVDHVIDVECPIDTQFTYDPKEFVLRTNFDIISEPAGQPNDTDLVYMDSALDNATTFVASTVSTAANGSWLFPIYDVRWYGVMPTLFQKVQNFNSTAYVGYDIMTKGLNGAYSCVSLKDSFANSVVYLEENYAAVGRFRALTLFLMMCKASDLYNVELFLGYDYSPGATETNVVLFDATGISTDAALVQKDVISSTHRYAFANLVFAGAKSIQKEVAQLNSEATMMLEKVAASTTKGPDPLPSATVAAEALKPVV